MLPIRRSLASKNSPQHHGYGRQLIPVLFQSSDRHFVVVWIVGLVSRACTTAVWLAEFLELSFLSSSLLCITSGYSKRMYHVYVGNLDSRVTERDLKDKFSAFEVIRSVWVACSPPGYVFIDFDDRGDAHNAIRELDGKNGWRVELSHNSRGGAGDSDLNLSLFSSNMTVTSTSLSKFKKIYAKFF